MENLKNLDYDIFLINHKRVSKDKKIFKNEESFEVINFFFFFFFFFGLVNMKE